jgi:transcription termination factor NusB
MRIERGLMVPLGFRSESIVGLESIEEGRGPGQRTRVYIEDLSSPIVASRSEGAILRDMVEMPKEVTKSQEQRQLLSDILDTIDDINPLLRSIIRDQGKWDLDRLEERIRDILRDEEE